MMPWGRGVQTVILVACLCFAPLTLVDEGAEAEPAQEWRWETELQFPQVTIEEDEVTMGDLPLMAGEGAPSLPFMNVMVPIPEGCQVQEIRVDLRSIERIGTVNSTVTTGESPLSSHGGGGLAPVARYPTTEVSLEGIHLLEGERKAIVNVFPASMEWSTGEVTAAESAELVLIGEVHPSVDMRKEALASGNVEVDYLIITSSELEPAFQSLVEWKTQRGGADIDLRNITAEIVTIEEIKSDPAYWGDPILHSGKGNDTQTQVRNLIIDYHQNHGTEYVLLGGDVEIIPCRMVYVSSSLSNDIPANVYYSGLDGSWDLDDDGIYGEGSGAGKGGSGEEADLLLEVSVGRATVNTVNEVTNFVNKVISYEMVRSDPYLNSTLLVGESLDGRPTWGGDYKDEVQDLTFPIVDPELEVRKLYERDGTFSSPAFVEEMNSGVHLINHMGHGDYQEFAGLQEEDISSLVNEYPFIMFSQACLIGGFDRISGNSIAEEFILSEHGAVAMLVNSRQGWYSPGDTDGSSQQFDIEFFDALFNENILSLGTALLDAKVDLVPQVVNTGSMRWCFMTLNLLGDPEMEVHFLVERDHDVAVMGAECERVFEGEEATVTSHLINLGQQHEEVPVELIVEGTLVNSTTVDIEPGDDLQVQMNWTPATSGVWSIEVRSNLTVDAIPSNDAFDIQVEVGWKIVGSETLSDANMLLETFLMVDDNSTLLLENSTLVISSHDTKSLECSGNLSMNDSTLLFETSGCSPSFEEGSHLWMNGSNISSSTPCVVVSTGSVEVAQSKLQGMGLKMVNGSIRMADSWIDKTDLALMVDDSTVELLSIEVSNSTSGILLNGSEGSLTRLAVTANGTGMRVDGCVNLTIQDSTVTGCERGLEIASSMKMVVRNNTLVGNDREISFDGTVGAHFDHEVTGNNVTDGELLYLVGGSDLAVTSGPVGYLALISCINCSISGLDLGGQGEGILFVNATGTTISDCLIQNSSVGVRFVESDDCTMIGNDLIGNEVDLISDSVIVLNGSHEEGGNHWSRYNGSDERSGPYQDQPGRDGLGDTTFNVTGCCVDRYPLMIPTTLPNDLPLALFNHSPLDPVTYQGIWFESLSRDNDGEIINWTWDLGDGSFQYGEETYHMYEEPGDYTVTLMVMDDAREWDDHSLVLTVLGREPSADFSFTPSFPDVGQEVSFHDLSTDNDGHIVDRVWSFGDGEYSDRIEPVHEYSMKGEYTITLIVWDDDDLNDTTFRTIVVGNEPPVSNFSFSPSSIMTGQEVHFEDLSADPDGEILTWEWEFGDGATSDLKDPVHSYSEPGSYTVSLTVTDDSGESSDYVTMLEAENRGPEASFDISPEVMNTGQEVFLQDTSTDTDGTIVAWYWDLGDGNSSSSMNVLHTYLTTGKFNITLTVWDDAGGNDTITRSVEIIPLCPTANFSFSPQEPFSLDRVSFMDLSDDPDGNLVSWSWDFGDGTLSNESSPSHAYLRPGDYDVTLIVTDNEGVNSSFTRTISVLNLCPESSFTWSFDPLDPMVVHLESTSHDPDGTALTHYWHFGDGGLSTQADPVHEFASVGNHTVSLIVVDSEGNSSLVQREIWVRMPDLLLDVDVTDDLTAGTSATVRIMVSNQGWLATNASVKLLIDGITINTLLVSVDGGGSTPVEMEWIPEAGNHTVSVEVEGIIQDQDPSDNQMSIDVSVSAPSNGGDDQDMILAVVAFAVVSILVTFLGIRGLRKDKK
jgi:parallel beta-helix repeat protein